MKSSTFPIRLTWLLILGALVAGTAATAAGALVGRPPDVQDTAAAANVATLVGQPPDVQDAAAAADVAVPDVFERYVAAHPYGRAPAQTEIMAAHFKHEDAFYRPPVSSSGPTRSATAIQVGAGDGFDWADYGVGIGTGIGLVLLFAGGLAGARQRRHPVQAA